MGVGLGLVLSAAPGAWAEGEKPVYPTFEDCWAAHEVPCGPVEGGWTPNGVVTDPNQPPDNSVTPEEDPEYERRQRMAMRVNTWGTLEHPVVAVDMNQVVFPDVQPYLDIEIGRVRVPIRFVAEQMGAVVTWDGDTQTVTISNDRLTINLQVDNPMATVNGTQIEIDAPPKLLPPGRVMVPLRFISEAFGANVDWVGDTPPVDGLGWGHYQVWIWVDWGYWGKWNMNDRLHVHSWWFYRGKGRQ